MTPDRHEVAMVLAKMVVKILQGEMEMMSDMMRAPPEPKPRRRRNYSAPPKATPGTGFKAHAAVAKLMLTCLEGVHQRLSLPLDEYDDAASFEAALVEFFEAKPTSEIEAICDALVACQRELEALR